MAYDEELADRLRKFARDRQLVEKSMFGGVGFLLNGKLAFSASSQGGLLLRADPADAEEFIDGIKAEPFRMRGREMTGWLHVLPAGLRTDDELNAWLQRGIDFVRMLPTPGT